MAAFSWGLVCGAAVSLAVAGVVAIFAYRRLMALERRTRHSERLAELGTLTSGLAHEIKNPLSTILGNLQMLREDLERGEHPDRVLARLNMVQRETGRLREILDDFLGYAGKIELERRPVELNGLLEELVDFFTPQAQLHRVQARVKRSAEAIVAPVDARRIKQAVLNLMLNAVQAMSERGGELILAASQTDGQAVIDVIDTGAGIAPEALANIFNAYYSTKPGGTGLGLALARRIAQEHGGEIRVVSEPGKGSDFSLRLPMR